MPTPDALLRAPLRTEAKLLYLTAWGPAADASIVDVARQVQSWPWFIAAADLERATRVAWQRLGSLGIQPTTPESRLQFEQLASIAAFRAQHLDARLQETLALLAREGIHVILLKGAALANTIYPSFIERPMGDIDLMVPPNAAERAHAIARSAGWTWDAATFPMARYAGHHHLPPLDDSARTGVRLELHAGIAIEGHPFELTFDELRARGRTVQVGNTPVIVPCAEHLLLHECVHFAWSHVMSFGSWRTARDVELMTQRHAVDWDAFQEDTRRHRANSCVYWTLALAQVLAGADVPPTILGSTQPRLNAVMRRFLERHFLYHLLPIEAEWPSQRLRKVLWEVAIQPDRHGHGPRRPWELDERSPEPTASEALGDRPRVVTRRSRLGVWAKYVRALS
ncbi:MAG: nucleotidyltransferase domain-containing protein [Gemmatimonadaceae bacterium]